MLGKGRFDEGNAAVLWRDVLRSRDIVCVEYLLVGIKTQERVSPLRQVQSLYGLEKYSFVQQYFN